MGCFPTGTYNCSYGELPLRQPFARRQQEVLPFQAGTFCLVARGLSPGGYECLQSSLHCCRLAIGSPKWPFALRPTCRNVRQQSLLSNRVAYAMQKHHFARLSQANSAICSQAAPPVENCVVGFALPYFASTIASLSPCKISLPDRILSGSPLQVSGYQ